MASLLLRYLSKRRDIIYGERSELECSISNGALLQVVVSVQYQVIKDNLYDAFYKLTDSRSQITSYVFDVVRATVPKIYLDDVFTTKDEIALGMDLLQ